MVKKFTQKETAILKKTSYTLRVSESALKFTKEFKEEFWRRYQAGERPKKIISDPGYNLDILGDAYPYPFSEVKVIIDDWMDYYNNQRYHWQLAKLSPNEYYQFITTGIYPYR